MRRTLWTVVVGSSLKWKMRDEGSSFLARDPAAAAPPMFSCCHFSNFFMNRRAGGDIAAAQFEDGLTFRLQRAKVLLSLPPPPSLLTTLLQVQLALEFLQSLDHSLVTTLIWIIQARVLLGTQAEHVEHLVEEGFLTPEAAEGYLETIRHDIQRLENVKYERNRSATPPLLLLFWSQAPPQGRCQAADRGPQDHREHSPTRALRQSPSPTATDQEPGRPQHPPSRREGRGGADRGQDSHPAESGLRSGRERGRTKMGTFTSPQHDGSATARPVLPGGEINKRGVPPPSSSSRQPLPHSLRCCAELCLGWLKSLLSDRGGASARWVSPARLLPN
jgi:hypothetical protein